MSASSVWGGIAANHYSRRSTTPYLSLRSDTEDLSLQTDFPVGLAYS